jgi:hypothetical protein
MEHDVTTGLHPLREPQSSIKESRSPHQPQVLFVQPPTGGAKTEGETSDDEDIKQIKRTFQGHRRKNQMLAGIKESSSAEQVIQTQPLKANTIKPFKRHTILIFDLPTI